MKREYKITELIYSTKDCMADPTISEFYLEGELKNVYHALYKWLRKQYCAVIAIDDVCTMYIGRLGDGSNQNDGIYVLLKMKTIMIFSQINV